MGRTLEFYIFTRVLKMIVGFMLGIATIAWLIDFSELSNRTSDLPQYTAIRALFISSLRVPFILQAVFPFVILFATMATLITLNRKYELVIARAAGMSAWQFLRPTWIAAFLVGLGILFVVNPLATYGFGKATEIEGSWRGSGERPSLANNDPWLRQNSETGAYFITASRVSGGERPTLLQAVFLSTDEDGRIVERLEADRARLTDSEWRLSTVRIIRAGRADEARDSMAIPTSLNPAVVTEALVQPDLIPFHRLGQQIELAQSFGVSAYPFRMQFHSMIALPLLLVTMSMIAATVSLRFARFGQSGTLILGGIGAGFMLYVVTEAAKSFGNAGIIDPVLAAWLPVLCAGLFGISYLLSREDG